MVCMAYYGRIRLEDTDGEDVYKDEGYAPKVLFKALKYCNEKGNQHIPSSIIAEMKEFLSNDSEAFAYFLKYGPKAYQEKYIKKKFQ